MKKITAVIIATFIGLSGIACSQRTVTQQAKSSKSYLIAVSKQTQKDLRKEAKKYPKGTHGRYMIDGSLETVIDSEAEQLENLNTDCFDKKTRSDYSCLVQISRVGDTVMNITLHGRMDAIKGGDRQYLLQKSLQDY